MKNRLGLACLLIGLFAFTTSCSDDDDSADGIIEEGGEVITDLTPTVSDFGVVINEVSYQGTDWVEIYNPTGETIDISNLYLCLGPGTYSQISSLEVLSGDTTLVSEGLVVIGGYVLPDEIGGLGLFLDDSFSNSESIIDFVQYGGSGTARENVAAEAGIWTAGDFLPLVVSATVVINEVSYGENDWVEIYNPTEEMIDVTDFWLCLGPGEYDQINTLTILEGSTALNGGEFLILEIGTGNIVLNDDNEGLGLYSDIGGVFTNFGNADFIVDFVQYGSSGSARENVAVEAGLLMVRSFFCL